MVLAYLGLGSNLGDRAANLWEAARRLGEQSHCRVARYSPMYETEPVGPPDQPWYLNAALAVETSLGPIALLHAVKGIEREIGRVPGERWGPRRIDVDILLFGDVNVDMAELTIPHRELWNRRFVLLPLATILDPGPLAERVATRLTELGKSPIVQPHRL